MRSHSKPFAVLAVLIALGSFTYAHAAPYYTYQPTLLPQSSNNFDIGTSTDAWRTAYITQLCLSGDCRTLWPSGGGGSSASSTLLSDTNTFSGHDFFNNSVGIGTTSPFGFLSVNPTAALGNAPAFVIGSSSATQFVVTTAGNVGINTANPTNLPGNGTGLTIGTSAAIGGQLGFIYSGAVDSNHEFLRNTGSDFVIGSSGVYPLWIQGGNTFYQGAGGMNISYTSNTVGVLQLGVGGTANNRATLSLGEIGIGTTTPSAFLTVVATSTNASLSNIFVVASSTGGTSTTTLLSVSNTGVLTLSQLATGCLQSTSGVVSSTGSACGSGGGGGTFPFTPVSYGNATSTTLGLLNGFLSQASSTINGTLAFSGLGIPAGQFAAFDPSGVLIATTTPSGGGGTTAPGGATGQIQYNENGVFNAGPLFSLATTTGVVTFTMGENILNPEAVIKLGHEGSVTNGYTSIQTQHGVGGSTTFTIPATTGTAVLGTGATSQLAQWTGTNTITNIATSTLYGVAPAGGMVLGWNNSTSAIGWIATSSSSGLSQWVTAGSSISYTAGNVGVGSTTPWAALSVSTTSQQLGTTPLFDVGSTTGLDLFNVMGNGNVGIGTTSPDSIFSINATGGKQILAIATTTSATSLQALLMDQNGNVGIDTIGTGVGLLTVGGRLSLGQQSVSTGVLDFFPSNGGSWFHIDNRTDNTLRISNGVNVGSVDNLIIGTNFVRDPGAFSVGATANTNAGTIIADGNFIGALSLINGTMTTKATLSANDPPYSFIGDTATGMGQFGLGSGIIGFANTGVTHEVFNGSNVGIGTTTPFGRLAVSLLGGSVPVGLNAFFIASSTQSATSTLMSVSNTGQITFASTTPQLTGASMTIGASAQSTNGTTTISEGKIQWDGYNSAGSRICSFFVGTTLTTVSGACTP